MAGQRDEDGSAGGAETMSLDAFADSFEEVERPSAAPPPLPPETTPRWVWGAVAIVVLIAAAAGLFFGSVFMGAAAEAPAPPTETPAAPASGAAPEPGDGEPGDHVIQIDEVVID